MKSYFLASFSAFIIGWLTMQVAFILAMYWTTNELVSKIDLLWFSTLSWFVNITFNIVFVQLPNKWVKWLYRRLSLLQFTLIMTIYALIIFILTFYIISVLSQNGHPKFAVQFTYLLLSVAAVNGFFFGVAFHTIWKPTRTE